MPQITEFHIQRAVCILLDNHGAPGLMYWHTPNGGARGGLEAKRFKEMGVKPGVADLLLFYKGHLFCLELKDEKGKLSSAQSEWLTSMGQQGATIAWANSLEGAKTQLRKMGLINC